MTGPKDVGNVRRVRVGVQLYCGAALGVAIAAIGAPAASAAAAPQVSGRVLTPIVAKNQRVQVAWQARNTRAARSARTPVAFVLSRDDRRSRTDAVLARRTLAAIAPKGRSAARLAAAVPKRLAPGHYRVLVCPARGRCRKLRGSIGITPRVSRVNATLIPDASRAATAVVGSDGGTIDAQGADGTRYRLVVPAGAIAGAVTMVMTPLAGAQGLPFEGLAAGVRLEPAGLELAAPARLLIRREGLAAGPGTAAFGSRDGRDLYLAPWATAPEAASLGPGTVAIGITHFSGWGAVSLTDTQAAAQYARSAYRAQDRLAQEMREAIDKSGDGTPEASDLPLQEMIDQIVKPLLDAALHDPVFLDDAVRAYLSLERQLQLLGLDGLPDDPHLAAKFKRAFKRYVEVLKERCSLADFATIGEAIGLARQMQLLAASLPSVAEAPQSLEEALAILDPCLRFELRMTSSQAVDWDFDFTGVTTAVVPLRFATGTLAGSGPLTYRSATYVVPDDDCTESVPATTGSTMVVEGGANLFQLSPPGPGKPAVEKPNMGFLVDPGSPTETLRVVCPNDPEPPTVQETSGNKLWLTLWAGCAHPDLTYSLGFQRSITGFTATGKAGILAELETKGTLPCVDGGLPAATVEERWEFAHTPASAG